MNNILNYFITNPCHFSSLLLSCNIPYTIYSGNSILLFTEIPICIASILYHHKFNINYIKEIDLMCGQLAYWQHMFYAFKYNNYFSIYSYLFCPVLYMGSKYFQYNRRVNVQRTFARKIPTIFCVRFLFVKVTRPLVGLDLVETKSYKVE